MNTLWRKTWRDLWLFKARTALVVVAIAVGTAAAGVAVTSLIVLRRDLREGYAATNPAHAILDTSPFDPALAGQVAGLPGVAAAEARRLDLARVAVGGEASPLLLWTLPDDAPGVGRLTPQDGAPWPPPPGTILLERSAGAVGLFAVGDEVEVRLSDGDTFRLTVAGFVHDMAVAPTTVQPAVYGYISDATAGRLGLPAEANQLHIRIVTSDQGLVTSEERSSLVTSHSPLVTSRADVETTVTAVTEWLEEEGVVVGRAGVPEPGVHLMQGNVDTGLLMIGILGGLTLLLGAFLVANVVGAVITQQTRQIGVLKALGGGRGLVLRLYGRMVLIFGGLALLVAVPLGLVGAWFMSSTLATQLNYDIPSFGLTAGTLLVQAAGALLVPLLAALGPLRAAARLSVREALGGEELTQRREGAKAQRRIRTSRKGRQERKGRKEEQEPHAKDAKSAKDAKKNSFCVLCALRVLCVRSFFFLFLRSSRPWRSLRERLPHQASSSLVRLATRNVARRPARLALTVAALALAGALFMATFGLRLGLYEAVEILVGEFPSDVIIDLERPQAVGRLRRIADDVETEFLLRNSVSIELWGVADARRLYDDGRAGSSFTLYGVPPTTQIAPFAERAGRWLVTSGEGLVTSPSPLVTIYINYETEKLLGRPGVGDELALRLNGRADAAARLVGISLRPFEAAAYMPFADFERATGERGRVGRVVVYMDEPRTLLEGPPTADGRPLPEGDAALAAVGGRPSAVVAAELTSRLEQAGIAVARTETAEEQRASYRAQFDTLVLLLMSLAGLTALVGGLGLGNTMALNVLERSREIGVLRAMGARRPLLRRLVLVEGLLIALVSAALAVPLAVPLTLALDRVMGNALLGSPLSFAFSWPAAVGWLGLVVVIGVVACRLPAERAGGMVVREALGYE